MALCGCVVLRLWVYSPPSDVETCRAGLCLGLHSKLGCVDCPSKLISMPFSDKRLGGGLARSKNKHTFKTVNACLLLLSPECLSLLLYMYRALVTLKKIGQLGRRKVAFGYFNLYIFEN